MNDVRSSKVRECDLGSAGIGIAQARPSAAGTRQSSGQGWQGFARRERQWTST